MAAVDTRGDHFASADTLEKQPPEEDIPQEIVPAVREQSQDRGPVPTSEPLPEITKASDGEGPPTYATNELLKHYIPHTNPNDPMAKTFRTRISKRKNMLKLQLGIAGVVVAFFSGLTWWLCAAFTPSQGVGTLYTGDCLFTSYLNGGAHVLVNIVSSAFLGVGNYCTQVLAAPSRADVDKYHGRGQSLNIGTQSIYNAFRIGGWKGLVWALLAITSALLHLIWNSTFFQSIPIVIYPTAVVTSDFKNTLDDWTPFNPYIQYNTTSSESVAIASLQQEWDNFTPMKNHECIATFINPLNATRKLVLVSENVSTEYDGSTLLAGFMGLGDPANWDLESFWICKQHAHHWKFLLPSTPAREHRHNVTISHCLVGKPANDLSHLCGFHYSKYLMIAVCVCAGISWILVLTVATAFSESTLVLVGDAIEEFLKPLPPSDIEKSEEPQHRLDNLGAAGLRVRQWAASGQKTRWFHAVSKWTWWASLPIFILTILMGFGLLGLAIHQFRGFRISTSIESLWNKGLGTTHPYALMGGAFMEKEPHGVDTLAHVIFANSFQLLVSILYLFYNNILTRQLAAQEFFRYFNIKDSLRVSNPKNITQQSSHFLSLPWKYAVSQIVSFIVLHWLISQSIFIVQTTAYGPGPDGQRLPHNDSSRLGFSPKGILLSSLWGTLLVIVLLGFGFFQKYENVPADFPPMATDSSAIKAFCHRPEIDKDAHLFPVQIRIVKDVEGLPEGCHGRLTFTISTAQDGTPENDLRYEIPTWTPRAERSKKWRWRP